MHLSDLRQLLGQVGCPIMAGLFSSLHWSRNWQPVRQHRRNIVHDWIGHRIYMSRPQPIANQIAANGGASDGQGWEGGTNQSSAGGPCCCSAADSSAATPDPRSC